MKRVILKPREEDRLLGGHPWVYANEVAHVFDKGKDKDTGTDTELGTGGLIPGEAVDVESSRKEYMGRGLANPRSKIIVRLYSPSKEGADKGFFKRRIREAINRRADSYNISRESARLVFGEADLLPGFLADRFVGWPLAEILANVPGRPCTFDIALDRLGPPSSWLSVQFLSFGMDQRRDMIMEAFDEVLASPDAALWFGPQASENAIADNVKRHDAVAAHDAGRLWPALAGVIERSANKARELEGLENREGLVRGSFPKDGIVIFENGYPMAVNLEEGQKTGHYLDQRDNRRLASAFACGRDVLDVCSNTGGFSIHAGRAGASSLCAMDASEPALKTLNLNAALNGLDESIIKTEHGDMFELLPRYEKDKTRRFDLVILDPPAFAKSRASLDGASRGYKEVNLRAIRLLKPGGVLVTCSCSQPVSEGHFRAIIAEAAGDAGRRLFQLDFRSQSPDHPVLVGYDESCYLKCGIYRLLQR